MNIGVDVDGVLNNLETFQIQNTAKYFKSKYNYCSEYYHIEEALGCTDECEKHSVDIINSMAL